MNALVEKNMPQLQLLCQKHHVQTMYLFGSMVHGGTAKSDVDMLVRFKEIPLHDYFDNFILFKFELEKLFARQVDLLEDQAIRNPYLRRSINQNKELIYGRAS